MLWGRLRWQLIADESEVVRWVITPGHAALVVSVDGPRRTNERQVLECFTKTPLPDSSKVGQPPRKRFSTLQLFVSVQEPPLGDSTPRTKSSPKRTTPNGPPCDVHKLTHTHTDSHTRNKVADAKNSTARNRESARPVRQLTVCRRLDRRSSSAIEGALVQRFTAENSPKKS